ncbi:MAG TPA: pirin family protein [Blastocatellia bacterium]|nr:pirin family protein [Blastocatellia bacterium]
MIIKRPARERGKTETHWLESFHTFSFNRYYDPRYTGFGDLLVINEDYVAPARGFPTHSHSDMEIITYVVRGRLAHKDSTGAESEITPGEVQRMSAGTGVSHSEFNPSETEPTHFLQIWIQPDEAALKPGYEQRRFSDEERRGRLRLVASRAGSDGSVTIHQDARLYDGLLASGDEVTHQLSPGRHAWIQVIKGEVTANGTPLQAGDGAAVSEESSLGIRAFGEAEILLFDLA